MCRLVGVDLCRVTLDYVLIAAQYFASLFSLSRITYLPTYLAKHDSNRWE